MEIREFTMDDYPAVSALWQRLDMWKPQIDSPAAVADCLARNPGLFLVGTDPAAGNRLLGTVIGTFDGRRAYLYHVAVDPDSRRQGIGRVLVGTIIARLWAAGAAKISLRVHHQNHGAIAFYESLGLAVDRHVLGMSIEREP